MIHRTERRRKEEFMEKKKLTETISANIHTIEIRTETELDVEKALNLYRLTHIAPDSEIAQANNCINTEISRINKNTKKTGRIFILNLNKWYGEHYNIPTYSDFCETLTKLTDMLGITGRYIITRADLKFDSPDTDFYDGYFKLFYLLISDVQRKIGELNFWIGTDAKSLRYRSIKLIRNGAYEFEYYNKAIESHGEDPAAARFEIRVINRKNGIPDLCECFNGKLSFLGSAILEEESNVIESYINALCREWKSDRLQLDMTTDRLTRGGYKYLYQFLDNEKVSDRIFSRPMCTELLQRITGCTKEQAEKRLENYNNSRGKMITYRTNGTTKMLEILKDRARRYFDN